MRNKNASAAMIMAALKEIQLASGMSDRGFAKHLSINRQMWRWMKVGQRNPGAATLARIQSVYPELYSAVLGFNNLAEVDHKLNTGGPQCE